jgi:hypothetical protein
MSGIIPASRELLAVDMAISVVCAYSDRGMPSQKAAVALE